jgi:hypothetical protein
VVRHPHEPYRGILACGCKFLDMKAAAGRKGPDVSDETQKASQRQLFYRNVVFLGASIVFFGAFVTLGSGLRVAITAPLFHF